MKNYNFYLKEYGEIGHVEKIVTPIVEVAGLPSCTISEMVVFEDGSLGEVIAVDQEKATVLLYEHRNLDVGQRVARTGSGPTVKYSESLFGSMVDSFGDEIALSTKSKSLESDYVDLQIYTSASDISTRSVVSEPFITGVTLIDLMTPLGRGQRELLIGDRKTGKTSFALQLLLAQKDKESVNIYACIGKNKSEVQYVKDFLIKNDLLKKTIIVASFSTSAVGKIYSTPYAAMSIAEKLSKEGKNVVLVLDDMLSHAKYYREISLLANIFPGRDSYPGDMFYVHARLLERAGNFNNGTSITCFPIVSTANDELSGYIETNLMSMTDGHLFFDRGRFYEGLRPAVDPLLSVTRVGRQTQNSLRWAINRELNSFFVLHKKTGAFIHFGAEVSEGVKATIGMGDRLNILFAQPAQESYTLELQMLMLVLVWSNYLSNISGNDALKKRLIEIKEFYESDKNFQNIVLAAVAESKNFNELIRNIIGAVAKFGIK
ncbi:hypothetical protein H6802_01605 [Candidatus Nomurabacteria bacterium]|uniref:ATPase F1/V1/A1 complex alpha/beta subunit nucleotide-binding domain-containing protein n=1 Tax=candidate division WWE3 bacterium TaxID=2053526 RepID=A0A955E1V8_UNCKA|nr:hypothetical protein [candidate division WWE3 bacterium]MCB9823630.1 hypothetical protein [Candidatus Nomurabacteria bacterium]MCB9827292.1 hypothetical protein [Candidatus Nomurabacteria bacterium]MCB9827425.1 hypothetical protein [Candidatus Nomurabacteria bacterium]HXK52753.1 hypothetical protein [bacterium]